MIIYPHYTYSLDDYLFFFEDIPILNSENWEDWYTTMEMLFYSALAEYFINPTPSTTIPPECSYLDSQVYSLLLDKVDVQFRPLVEDSSSGLQAWLALWDLHNPQLVVTTPIPDDSYATVRTSTPDLAPITPSPPSVIPFLTSPSIPIFNSYSAGSAYASYKHFTPSTLHGFKKHFAAYSHPSEDFQYEIYLYCSKWLVQVPGPGPPLPMDTLKTSSTLLGFSGSIFLSFCLLFYSSRVLIQWECWNYRIQTLHYYFSGHMTCSAQTMCTATSLYSI
jgi:hypothetical protein